MADEKLENVQRWTAKRRSALVMQVLKVETSVRKRPDQPVSEPCLAPMGSRSRV